MIGSKTVQEALGLSGWDGVVREVEPWDPTAEGLCGECAGEQQVTTLQWTPWGIIPVAGVCRTCKGTGKLQGGGHVEAIPSKG